MPTNKKKKKAKRQERNEKTVSCQGCSKRLEKKNFVYCVCTQVRFCSSSCQQMHPHDENDCPGPPKTVFDMEEQMKQIPVEEKLKDLTAKRNRDLELEKTVNGPSLAYIVGKGLRHIANMDLSAWDLAYMADEGSALGNQACAFLAGSRFRHRMLGTPRLKRDRDGGGEHFVCSNWGEDNIPVLESEELAFRYFEKAAKLGHGLSMQSLGTCFDDGVGCRVNRRRCNQWLWRACLHNSAGASELLDGRALLPIEINANGENLEQMMDFVQPGQAMSMSGPNLAALLMAFSDVVRRENYSLPPFAGTWATATVDNPVRPMAMTLDRPRTPLIGANSVRELLDKTDFLGLRGNRVKFGYCRRGAAKQATSQTRGEAARSIDNQLFLSPPMAACDERVNYEIVQDWHQQCIQLLYGGSQNQFIQSILCVHKEKNQEDCMFCRECEAEAIERLGAISEGSVILSLNEDLQQRGQAAIFRGKNGSLKNETWKTYAGGEAECVLAVLAASGHSQYVAPLFIAQDPNFLWPLIADHGSIRAALEFVAPHVDWIQRIGRVKYNIQEQIPVIPSCRPGKYLVKCGNSFCNNLEDYNAKMFSLCNGCNRRRYCSAECQRSDWTYHKRECRNNNAKQVDPRLDDLGQGDCEGIELKYQLKLEYGQDCVIHGLQAKPHYNGMVGIVGDIAEDGRIAVTLRSRPETVLSIKPSNLHCIGVFSRKRKKKSRVFECVHGLDVCANCYLDFTTINRLAKLKYDGQDMTSAAAIERVVETHFSSFPLNGQEGRPTGNWPLECKGMEQHPKQRFILKALLRVKTPMSLHAEVAKTAFITYGAAFTEPVLRADTKLDDVAKML